MKKNLFFFFITLVSLVTSMSYVSAAAPGGLDVWEMQRTVNVRSSARMGNNLIDHLNKGDKITVAEVSKNNFWCKINFKKYKNAWIACKFIDESPR